jgi:hypothetical protein
LSKWITWFSTRHFDGWKITCCVARSGIGYDDVSIFIDGALMNTTHTSSATPIVLTIINDKKKNSTVVGFFSEKLPVPKDVLNNILLNKKIKFKSQRDLIMQIALKQLNFDFYFELKENAYNYLHSIVNIGPKNTISISSDVFLSKKITVPEDTEIIKLISLFINLLNKKINLIYEKN